MSSENIVKMEILNPKEELVQKQVVKTESKEEKAQEKAQEKPKDEPIQKIEKTKTTLDPKVVSVKQTEVSKLNKKKN